MRGEEVKSNGNASTFMALARQQGCLHHSGSRLQQSTKRSRVRLWFRSALAYHGAVDFGEGWDGLGVVEAIINRSSSRSRSLR